ncbi:MAG: 4-(cytidine 5'-diphospho)-2-C-methyl-D-erythritol kinase [Minwuia sp.]|nr:4-(cytidine 5'-diphospho)-2-C-methyl-D-erythritol kinase [Minwuia sp.]
MTIVRDAPAKLNLFLHVVGRRADGLHLLQSLVAFTDIGDRITAEIFDGAGFQFQSTGPFATALDGESTANLVVRAATGLAALAGRSLDGLRLTLEKNLPVASGIGGGSADAAATLHALMALWSFRPDGQALNRLALELGADVPVCLAAQPSLMEGIGEHLTPTTLPAGLGVLLVNPVVEVPTPSVFRQFARESTFSASLPQPAIPAGDRSAWLDSLTACRNDLQQPAIALCPVIEDVLNVIGACAGVRLHRMSGSGATCIGLFDTPTEAQAARQTVGDVYPDWWCAAGALHHQ